MKTNLEKQSWASVLFLSAITLGIYVPFWYRKVKKATDSSPVGKKIDKNFLLIFMILAIINAPFSFHVTFNGVTYGINTGIADQILNLILIVIEVLFAFKARKLLMEQFNSKINPVMTFFFGPLYLQSRINNIIDVSEFSSPSQQSVQ